MSSSSNKIALFIDGANLYATSKTLGFDIDYKRLLKEFQSRGTLLRAFYYTAVIQDQEFTSIRPLIDWLDYNGYTVVTKATKEFVDAEHRRRSFSWPMADGPTLSIVEIVVIAPRRHRGGRALQELRRVITRFTRGRALGRIAAYLGL